MNVPAYEVFEKMIDSIRTATTTNDILPSIITALVDSYGESAVKEAAQDATLAPVAAPDPKEDVRLIVQCFVTYRVDSDDNVFVEFDPTEVDFDFLTNVEIDNRNTGIGQDWADATESDQLVTMAARQRVEEVMRGGRNGYTLNLDLR